MSLTNNNNIPFKYIKLSDSSDNTKGSSEEVRKLDELNILIDISNGLNQTKIADKYHKSKSTISEYFKKRLGRFIKKVGYGTWELTELGTELLDRRDLEKSKEYFYDDLQVTYQVRMKDASMFKDGQWNLNKFVTFSQMKFGDWTVRNNGGKSITIIFPKLYGQTDLEPIAKAYFCADRAIEEVVKRYPQIEVINPIPRLRTGSIGSTTLNKLLQPVTQTTTIRSNDYSVDNTPKPAIEMKDNGRPSTAAGKLKETLDFVVSGAYRKEMEEMKEANKIVMAELSGLALTVGDFTRTFREFIEMMKESIKR